MNRLYIFCFIIMILSACAGSTSKKIDRSEVQLILGSNILNFRKCIPRDQWRKKYIVNLAFTVDSLGNVTKSSVEKLRGEVSPSILSCVQKHLSTLKFPRSINANGEEIKTSLRLYKFKRR